MACNLYTGASFFFFFSSSYLLTLSRRPVWQHSRFASPLNNDKSTLKGRPLTWSPACICVVKKHCSRRPISLSAMWWPFHLFSRLGRKRQMIQTGQQLENVSLAYIHSPTNKRQTTGWSLAWDLRPRVTRVIQRRRCFSHLFTSRRPACPILQLAHRPRAWMAARETFLHDIVSWIDMHSAVLWCIFPVFSTVFGQLWSERIIQDLHGTVISKSFTLGPFLILINFW